jgi:hypothetical protein
VADAVIKAEQLGLKYSNVGSAIQGMLAGAWLLRNTLNINIVCTRKLGQSITCLSLPDGEVGVPNAGDIHDVNNTYTWSSTGSVADGTAFTDLLATLNTTRDGDATTACTSNPDCTGIGNGLCGLAGHRDWRLLPVGRLCHSTPFPALPW